MAARILVVEDNPTNLELLVYLLRAFGYTVLTAANGLEALDRLSDGPVDLIVCDLEMPGMDGYELAGRLRSDVKHRWTPMVAVSAYAMVGDQEKILAAGFDAYLSKPIDPDRFVKSVESHLPRSLQSKGLEPTVEGPAAEPAAVPKERGLILVVDDSPMNLQLLQSTLEPSGYEVVSAASVREAQQKLSSCVPDLVLSDLHLSGDSGLELLRSVKADPRLKGTPCILFSASSPDMIQSGGTPDGIDLFLSRPIDPERLLAVVEMHLVRK